MELFPMLPLGMLSPTPPPTLRTLTPPLSTTPLILDSYTLLLRPMFTMPQVNKEKDKGKDKDRDKDKDKDTHWTRLPCC